MHEQIAFTNVIGAYNYMVGDWINSCKDNELECLPKTIQNAKDTIYWEAMDNYYIGGDYIPNKAPKEMRFATKEFIQECIGYLFSKDEEVKQIAKAMNW